MSNFKLTGGEQHFMLFADGKSTGDSRISVYPPWQGVVTKHVRSGSFLLLTGNEATQDARYSR